MKSYNFYIPTRIVFGSNKIEELNTFIPKEVKKILLVTDKNLVEKTTIILKISEILKFEFVVFQETEENPSLETIKKGAEFGRSNQVDFIIGVGGGSSMDAAKGIAILITNGGEIMEYINGKGLTQNALPIICIPTTSGTGSEVTPYAVFTDPKEEIKTAIAHDQLFPQTSIIDPELTYSMPKSVIINTGLDALSHSVEAYLSTESFDLNDQLALESIELIIENLENASNSDHSAMAKMAHASMLGGIAIAHASTILPHIMGYPLTVFHQIPHGLANAIILPEFLEFMRRNSTETEKVNNLFNLFEKVDGIKKFIHKLGISTKLSDYGIKKSEIDLFAEKTIVKGDVKITPAELSKEKIVEIYKASF